MISAKERTTNADVRETVWLLNKRRKRAKGLRRLHMVTGRSYASKLKSKVPTGEAKVWPKVSLNS